MKKTLSSYFLTVNKNYELSVEKIGAGGFDASGGEAMKRYILHMFADGSEELIDIGGEAPAESSGTAEGKAPGAGLERDITVQTSARIYQTLLVLDYIRRNMDQHKKPNGEPDAENALRAGIKHAAAECGLPTSTIMDKFLRQMNSNIGQWREYVRGWMKTGEFTPIFDFLEKQINNRGEEEDPDHKKDSDRKKRSERTCRNDLAALEYFNESLKHNSLS